MPLSLYYYRNQSDISIIIVYHHYRNQSNGHYHRGHNGQYHSHSSSSHSSYVVGAVAFSLFGFGKKEQINEFNVLVQQARRAESNLQLAECDRLYHEALLVLDEQRHAKQVTELQFIERQTVVYDALANVCLLQGRVRQGEQLLKATLQGLFACGRPEDDNAVVEISLKLANIYALQRREAEAQAGYRFCYRSLSEKLAKRDETEDTGDEAEDTSALLGLTCDNYARYLLSRDDYIQAEHFFLEALKISQSTRQITGQMTDQLTTA